MRRRVEIARTDGGEVRFGIQEWLGAMAGMGVLLAGAGLVLGVAYWIVTHI